MAENMLTRKSFATLAGLGTTYALAALIALGTITPDGCEFNKERYRLRQSRRLEDAIATTELVEERESYIK